MKALSIPQPWAWLIVNGFKDIENRSWSTKIRGKVFIHASKGMTHDEYNGVKRYLCSGAMANHEAAQQALKAMPSFDQIERGGIVGEATIVNCIHPKNAQSVWHMDEQYGFELTDATPITFKPYKGQLGFFDVAELI